MDKDIANHKKLWDTRIAFLADKRRQEWDKASPLERFAIQRAYRDIGGWPWTRTDEEAFLLAVFEECV